MHLKCCYIVAEEAPVVPDDTEHCFNCAQEFTESDAIKFLQLGEKNYYIHDFPCTTTASEEIGTEEGGRLTPPAVLATPEDDRRLTLRSRV